MNYTEIDMCQIAKIMQNDKRFQIAADAVKKILNALFIDDSSAIFWGKTEGDGVSAAQICKVRVKKPASIEKKIEKKRAKGDGRSPEAIFNSLTDLVGGRVVFTTAAEAKAAGRFINVHFHVDDFNSGDKAETKKEEEFGYLSVHHIIILKDDFFRIHKDILELEPEKVEEHAKLFKESPLKLEIQTRSLLQHAWAETAHNTIYKPGENMDIPPESKRRLNSIAAVLENADNSINDLMYLFNAQKTQSENKYKQIADDLQNMFFSDLSNWDSYSLKSLLFEITEFIKFHPQSIYALTVKVMAKTLLVLHGEANFTFPAIEKRAQADKLKITHFKNRRDDIFNTLMTVIRLLKLKGEFEREELPEPLNILKKFCEKNTGEKTNFIATIELLINLLSPKKKTENSSYVFWMCDLKRAEDEVKDALLNAVSCDDGIKNCLQSCCSLCMIHPTRGSEKEGYVYDDSDQLAKRLPDNRILFSADLKYEGTNGNWAVPRYKTNNRRYSLYESLHCLSELQIDPRNIKFIGYNLQRVENTLCRFALAIGASTLIIKHDKMNRYRSVMEEPEWTSVDNFTVCDISEKGKIQKFLSGD